MSFKVYTEKEAMEEINSLSSDDLENLACALSLLDFAEEARIEVHDYLAKLDKAGKDFLGFPSDKKSVEKDLNMHKNMRDICESLLSLVQHRLTELTVKQKAEDCKNMLQ